jgi:hypothetical protein
MSTNTLAAPTTISNTTTRKNWALWAGRGLTAVPTLMLAMSSLMKLSSNPQMVEMLTQKFGYPASAVGAIGVLELASTILYAIPRTAILGAILISGYLGGAIATHVRAGDAGGAIVPLALAVFAWGGLFLRDKRVQALLPFRARA